MCQVMNDRPHDQWWVTLQNISYRTLEMVFVLFLLTVAIVKLGFSFSTKSQAAFSAKVLLAPVSANSRKKSFKRARNMLEYIGREGATYDSRLKDSQELVEE